MSAICVWDLTLNADVLPEIDAVKALFKEHCKKWVFQKEVGKITLKTHLQGRISLKIKNRENFMHKTFPGWHYSRTTTENHDNFHYVEKADTRIDGPWSSEDKEPLYIPKQIRLIDKLHPWQQSVIDNAHVWDTRTINVLIDAVGNKGKSILATYIGVHNLGRSIPFMNDFKDISRMILDTEKKCLYIIDLPRALRKNQLYQFISGVEQLKNGYAFDDRYSFKEAFFDCPNIWIFMNTLPDVQMLSQDRWRFWSINDNLELVPHVTLKIISTSSESSSSSDES